MLICMHCYVRFHLSSLIKTNGTHFQAKPATSTAMPMCCYMSFFSSVFEEGLQLIKMCKIWNIKNNSK